MLLAEKTLQGEMDATLNYWNICAALEAKGFRRLVGVEDILPRLGAKGSAAMLGYVFDEAWAAKNRDAVARFIAVTRKAKEILATSDAEWERIAPLIGAERCRRRSRSIATAIARAFRAARSTTRRPMRASLFRVLATQGGAEPRRRRDRARARDLLPARSGS